MTYSSVMSPSMVSTCWLPAAVGVVWAMCISKARPIVRRANLHPAKPGEEIQLQLEMKVLADIGLLGFPNAGKSTLISTVSAARPKVADYPFTTLYPNLGVVRVGLDSSFVIADIPGLIEGAAEGAGLGVQFLKHLQRTRLLLHLVEIAPSDEMPPADAVRKLTQELVNFDVHLGEKPRWLVFTKTRRARARQKQRKLPSEVVKELNWTGTLVHDFLGDPKRYR